MLHIGLGQKWLNLCSFAFLINAANGKVKGEYRANITTFSSLYDYLYVQKSIQETIQGVLPILDPLENQCFTTCKTCLILYTSNYNL
jgi:hypothetical protein